MNVIYEDSMENLRATMQAVANGDRAAFSRLYDLTSHRLLGVALHILRRRDWAEEVLQEGFVSIWRKAASFDPSRGDVLPWMATVVRYRTIDLLRSRQRETKAHHIMRDENQGGAPSFPPVETKMQLSLCLGKLQENHRKAILMAFFYGFTHGELAEEFDVPLGTVKSWVRHGLGQLKECLGS